MPKTDNELVSIIIPAYNCAEYIEETVASALASTYPHIEIIITNDGSIDSTAEVIEQIVSKHPEIKAFHQRKYAQQQANPRTAYGREVAFLFLFFAA